jgi:hypothetical protein
MNSVAKMSGLFYCISSSLGLNALLCWTQFGLPLDAVYITDSSFVFKCVDSYTDPIVHTSVSVLHKLIRVRSPPACIFICMFRFFECRGHK